ERNIWYGADDLLRTARTARDEWNCFPAKVPVSALRTLAPSGASDALPGLVPPVAGSIIRAAPVPVSRSLRLSYPVIDYTLPSPIYVFLGSASASYPQLVFNDGTSYTVADYWRVDDQLHFITVEEGGTKFVPHTVPFDDLDVERTKDRAIAGGFRFLIREKPIEQWLEDRTQEHEARRETDKKR
ncbi:MAG: hypothetical protein ABI233_09575, partial [Chthoniobacterales bacterium]